MAHHCRVCTTALQTPIVALSSMPLTDDFINVSHLDRKEYLSDIHIFECQYCGLVQNPADFNHQDYYRDYQYTAGHSPFVKNFMRRYAETVCKVYQELNHRQPVAVLEIGSGDGMQLQQFRELSVLNVLGIEPSEALAETANAAGITTLVDLFGAHSKHKLTDLYDVCLSSYTLDHIRNPVEYLQTAYALLNDGGLLVFEVHNLEMIVERTEYCLFEHEHTIYLTPETASQLVSAQGFQVVAINPLSSGVVRGNSLILLAQKNNHNLAVEKSAKDLKKPGMLDLQERIKSTIAGLDAWIAALPAESVLVGFGAGGRGVMTLAALKNAHKFKALFDSNYESDRYLTPKTRIPVIGPDQWGDFSQAYCLVFSFGYFAEIKNQLLASGFALDKIVSLEDFFSTDGAD